LLALAPPLAASRADDAPTADSAPRPTPPTPPAPPKPDLAPFIAPPVDRPEMAAIRQWFTDLDDPDASVREQARVGLMGMKRRDLPAFQKLVGDSRPLAPAQAAVLRQLVMHVYLAGEPYETTGAQGFLGVRMQDTSVRVPAVDRGDPATPGVTPAVGVVIVERMPGFVGARMLLDGDVILGVTERQDIRMLGVFEFQTVVQSILPGDTVHFQILRQGQVIRVPITLDPRPAESEPVILQHLIQERQNKAEAYWDRTFAGLVKERVG
jgi:hypothetical protein